VNDYPYELVNRLVSAQDQAYRSSHERFIRRYE
jgi:hypothetical protein